MLGNKLDSGLSELAQSTTLTLQLCGTPALLRSDGLTFQLDGIDSVLLGYLALEGPTPRSRLIALLWPKAHSTRARGNLRQRIFRLKRATGVDCIKGGEVASLSSAVHVQRIPEQSDESLCMRPLLDGVQLGDVGPAKAWLSAARERYQKALRQDLESRFELLETSGELHAALKAAIRLTELPPVSEEAFRRVMRIHTRLGDRAAALAAYERCVEVMMDEIGTHPSARTRQLAHRVASEADLSQVGCADATISSDLQAPLIGRAAAWETLARARAKKQPVLIFGDVGVGKTRILTEFYADDRLAIVANARAGDARVPYGTLTRLVTLLLARLVEPLPSGVQRELARLVPSLGDPPSATAGVEAAQARFHSALETLVEGSAASSSIAGSSTIVIEDIHYADLATMEALQRLVGAQPRINWVFSGRAGEMAGSTRTICDELVSSRLAKSIHLPPFDEADIEKLLEYFAVPNVRPHSWSLHLLQHTGGNPLFLLETIRQTIAEPTTKGNSTPELPFPATAIDLLKRRLSALGAEPLLLAQCAAVAGQAFSLSLARQVLSQDQDRLLQTWAELEERGILRADTFVHGLFTQAVLESTPTALATLLHRKCAEYLTDIGNLDGTVAEHWLAAGEHSNAGAAFRRAADQALKRLRLRESVDLLQRAASAFLSCGDRQRSFEALLQAMPAVELLVTHDSTEEILATLSQVAETAEQKLVALAEYCLHVHEQPDKFAETESLIRCTLKDLIPALQGHLATAHLQLSLASILKSTGRIEEAGKCIDAARPIISQQGRDRDKSLLLNWELHFLLVQDKFAAVVEIAENAVKLKGPIRDWSNIDRAYLLFPWVESLIQGGRSGAALELLESWPPTNSADGFVHCVRMLAYASGQMAMGRFRNALQALKQLRSEEDLPPHVYLRADLVEAQIYLRLGEPKVVMQILNVAREVEFIRARVLREMLLAQALRQQGLPHAEPLERAAEILRGRTKGPPFGIGHSRRRLELEMSLDGAPRERYIRALGVLSDVPRNDHLGQYMAAQIRCAQAALDAGEANLSASHAQEVELLMAAGITSDICFGEASLAIWRSYSAAGNPRACEVLSRAVDDIRVTAETEVPEDSRANFLSSNSFNRMLLEADAALRRCSVPGDS